MSLPASSKRSIEQMLRRYYSRRPLVEPSYFPKREIAIQPVGAKSYIRHLNFPSIISLYRYIEENPPLHLYYSSAIYDNPGAEDMESKEWLGSELIFDIDADHYEGCGDTLYVCRACGHVSHEKIKECPRCGSHDIASIPLLPEECIRRAWRDAVKLSDILREEYGFHDIHLEFSGNRGFHIRVADEEALPLTRDERRMIADYVRANMFRLDYVAPPTRGPGGLEALFLRRGEKGVRRRLLQVALETLGHEERGEVYVFNYGELSQVVDEIRVEIDTVVTMDPTRLSRFINSVNGKAGLRVTGLSPNTDPDEIRYEAFRVFGGMIRVKHLVDLPPTSILWGKVSLRKGYVGKMDSTIAFYLAVRGLVEIIDTGDLEVA